MTTMSAGRRANTNGRAAEETIMGILRGKGYQPRGQQEVGIGIFGSRLNADILLLPCTALPRGLAIESKWQDVPGTADEKLAFLWANISEQRYPCPVMVVAHGGGHRPGAIAWLKSKVDGERLLAVLALEEFLSWVNRSL